MEIFLEANQMAVEYVLSIGFIIAVAIEFIRARGLAWWEDGQTFQVVATVEAALTLVFTVLLVFDRSATVQSFVDIVQFIYELVTNVAPIFGPLFVATGLTSWGTHQLAKVVRIDAKTVLAKNVFSRPRQKKPVEAAG